MLYVILLGFAVSFDALLAGVAYGVRKITVPFSSLLVVGAVTAVCTAVAMIAAQGTGMLIAPQSAVMIGAFLLLLIGLWSVFQEYLIKRLTPRRSDDLPQLRIKLGKLIVNILADPEAVDIDHSRSISPSEAIFLGLALGLDNMVATFAAELLGVLPLYTPLVMAVIQMGLIWSGITFASRLLPESVKERFPYLPGTLLIIMSVLRIVK
ncbi:sporulation membrane protein YtaF [Anaerosporomusa subterranea]|nr:sporulation membrane protein YtaF [Anaerosporomusa subterranea]